MKKNLTIVGIHGEPETYTIEDHETKISISREYPAGTTTTTILEKPGAAYTFEDLVNEACISKDFNGEINVGLLNSYIDEHGDENMTLEVACRQLEDGRELHRRIQNAFRGHDIQYIQEETSTANINYSQGYKDGYTQSTQDSRDGLNLGYHPNPCEGVENLTEDQMADIIEKWNENHEKQYFTENQWVANAENAHLHPASIKAMVESWNEYNNSDDRYATMEAWRSEAEEGGWIAPDGWVEKAKEEGWVEDWKEMSISEGWIDTSDEDRMRERAHEDYGMIDPEDEDQVEEAGLKKDDGDENRYTTNEIRNALEQTLFTGFTSGQASDIADLINDGIKENL